ncbi:hypothetical protein DRP98_03120 [candidate division KSB1 bacterium]|nr:MAG: hypothetical protein DRP98_03120 [candidate division KSB1 bacterium]
MRKCFFSLLIILSLPALAAGQYFGKNSVQYTNFDWRYIQSEHFDIYFYTNGERIAEFVADIAESSYQELRNDFRYDLTDRITIIIYKGHNDFEQTNVALSTPEESVGGFTEIFKNRVVIPFEGNYEQLRHVVHHELTHAVMFQMLYGAGVQSIIMGMMRLQLPLWLVEGLAEYESLRWDTESDMYIRDAALNGYLPSIDRMYGFMWYKGGQHILYYLAEKYGPQKIGEILGKIKITKSLERGLKHAIGINSKELSERWHKYVKKQYWPDIANRQEPEDFAKKLTDHLKTKNFVNTSPALSPKGDKIAYLSNKSDYFDIYLMSAIDGKSLGCLVKGQRTMNLEELHWLKPGISWSPDEKYIAFAAKKGPDDVLHILNVKKRKIVKTFNLGLNGLFSPTWSPHGDEIAFCGVLNGQSDIYILNLNTGKSRKITNDIFSDIQPAWSPDGKFIAFVSDRGHYINPEDIPANLKIQHTNYHNPDIYIVDVTTQKIRRITQTEFKESYPAWSPKSDKLVFSCDKNGIFNLFIYDLKTAQQYPITNVLTGIFQPSWVKNRLVFTCFYYGGYDIYVMKNPLDIKPGDIKLTDTNFICKLKTGKLFWVKKPHRPSTKITAAKSSDSTKVDYRHYIFGREFREGHVTPPRKKLTSIFLDSTQYKLPSGKYRVNKYKIRFTPDLIYGSAGYDQFFGVQGSMVLAISDILGNHRINMYYDLFYDLRNSNYSVSYLYLPRRLDLGIGLFHFANFYLTDFGTIIRDRNYGGSVYAAWPFDRWRRVSLSLIYLNIDRRDITWDWPLYTRRVLIGNLEWVKDTTIWGYTGPTNGNRYNLSLIASPYIGTNSLDFRTIRLDWRKYYKFYTEYNFAIRVAAGASFGKNPQKFFLGGIDNWINYHTKDGGLRIDDVDEVYFSSWEMPLRGANYYEQTGTRFFLTNLEFRFPLIRTLVMGIPPILLQHVRGALFCDIGSAWYENEKFQFFKQTAAGSLQFGNVIVGLGIGARVNLGMIIFRYDLAWRADTGGKPRSYFSLGTEF